MRQQKKKKRYNKKPRSERKARKEFSIDTTESVVVQEQEEIIVEKQAATISADLEQKDNTFKVDLIRIGVATLAAVILFGIVGYLAMKTEVIENWSQRLLDWFNLV